ncbi:MAG: aminoacyl--tRNA ligase-related protein [Candidatus Helarchaeales archaeon]
MSISSKKPQKKKIPKLPPKKNLEEWYPEILLRTQVIDKRIPDSRGFYGYPPYGSRILILLEELFIKELESTGHEPIRTPTVIPETLLTIEKEHAEGFAPEVWVITEGRDRKPLSIPKMLRPTGETLIYSLFHYWIRSHVDLPLKTYERRPSFRAEPDNAIQPFLRSHEFYWIEAHDAFSSYEEAVQQVREDMMIFERIVWDKLAIPFMLFKRPEWDKFAGADYTCAYDTPLDDGKVLQIGTTHNLGQRFAKAFDVTFQTEENVEKHACQTCFGPGISRIVGALVIVHGDDQGLVLPPAIAPVQVIIIPIPMKGKDEEVHAFSEEILDILKPIVRVKLDHADSTPGFKFYSWEEKGVPLRIEIGPREVEANSVLVVDRLHVFKETIARDELQEAIPKLLDRFTSILQERVKDRFKIAEVNSLEEIEKRLEEQVHLLICPFCDDQECIDFLKDNYNLKVRGIPLFTKSEKDIDECEKNHEITDGKTKCLICNERLARRKVYLARQY